MVLTGSPDNKFDTAEACCLAESLLKTADSVLRHVGNASLSQRVAGHCLMTSPLLVEIQGHFALRYGSRFCCIV